MVLRVGGAHLDLKCPFCDLNAIIQPRDVTSEWKPHFSEEDGQRVEEEINLRGGSQLEPMDTREE